MMRVIIILLYFPVYITGNFIGNCTEAVTCFNKCCNQSAVLSNKTCLQTSSYEDFGINRFYNGTLPVRETIKYGLNLNCSYLNHLRDNCKITQLNAETDEYYIQANGSLYLITNKYIRFFCSEYIVNDNDGNNDKTISAVTSNKFLEEPRKSIATIAMIISTVSLLLTLMIYGLFPVLNLHRKAVICFVLSLLLAYVSWFFINSNRYFMWFQDDANNLICVIFGYSALYFLIAAFLWMNVLSIDIYLSFRQLRINRQMQWGRKCFLFYSIYAWGVTTLYGLILLLIDKFTDDAEGLWYDPAVRSHHCFVANRYPRILYINVPTSLVMIINLILFLITARNLRRIKNGMNALNTQNYQKSNYNRDKLLFQLYVKFFCFVGANWLLEVVIWIIYMIYVLIARDHVHYEVYIVHFCNAAHGLIIFVMLVVNKQTWKILRKRFSKGRNTKASQKITAQTTTS